MYLYNVGERSVALDMQQLQRFIYSVLGWVDSLHPSIMTYILARWILLYDVETTPTRPEYNYPPYPDVLFAYLPLLPL